MITSGKSPKILGAAYGCPPGFTRAKSEVMRPVGIAKKVIRLKSLVVVKG